MEQNFYLDSSENNGEAPEFALAWYGTLEEAQLGAVEAAREHPTRIYYVHEIIRSHRLVYQAEATINLDTKVIDGTPVTE